MHRTNDIALMSSKYLDNWFLVEWKDHDGQEWWEQTSPNSSSFRRSARVSDADVEGSFEEMVAIVKAIREKGTVIFKRCAVDARDWDRIAFWSPRNSETPEFITIENCKDFLDAVDNWTVHVVGER